MPARWLGALPLLLGLATPALAQITVLDSAQDQLAPGQGIETTQAPAAPACGTQPLAIARMGWPSAQLLAEIHARILRQSFGCTVQVTPGDLAATGTSMAQAGQPAIAPEMWVGRIAQVWNDALQAQTVRAAAPAYDQPTLEGWFVPDFVAPELTAASGLAAAIPTLVPEGRLRFVSCPPDWACALINRHLVQALGLTELVDLVEPANRFEMDTLIAQAVSRQEPIVFYYWQPNAVLAQFAFRALDMGAYDEEAAKCLAQTECPAPVPSAFSPETVVSALAERVFTDTPTVAAYFSRATLPVGEMNAMLAQLNEAGATPESVADRFVAERGDVWQPWVGAP